MDPTRSPAAHAGFTAVELLVVIGVMMVMMGMAVPAVMPALRKGALRSAVTDIESCWSQAQILARRSTLPAGTTPKHYGIVITQAAGQRPAVALIYDSVAASPALLHPGHDTGRPPVMRRQFNRNVILGTATDATGATVDTSDRTLVVYAQYQTGLPISGDDVAAGRGMVAAPTSIGVSATAALARSVNPALEVRTQDYVPGTRGYAVSIQLYHAGFIAVESIRE